MPSIDRVPTTPPEPGAGRDTDTGPGSGRDAERRGVHRAQRRRREQSRRLRLVRMGGLAGAAIAAGSVLTPWYSTDNHLAVPALFPEGSRTARSALDASPRHAWIAVFGALVAALLLAWPRQGRRSMGGRALVVESVAGPMSTLAGLALAVNVMWATLRRPPMLGATLDPSWGLVVAMLGAVIVTTCSIWLTSAERSGDT